jgi:hypothetical protein
LQEEDALKNVGEIDYRRKWKHSKNKILRKLKLSLKPGKIDALLKIDVTDVLSV